MTRTTYTYAIVPVSQSTYDEVRKILSDAGYQHLLGDDEDGEVIDMHGLALQVKEGE